MRKECKLTDKTLDAIFVRVDSIEETFKAEHCGLFAGYDIHSMPAYPDLTRVVKVRVGNQIAEFENTTLTVINPKIFAEAAQQQAWEMAGKMFFSKKDGGYSMGELHEIFGEKCSGSDIYKLSYKEVTEKIEAWENRIQVGDEVKPKGGEGSLVVVTAVYPGVTGDYIYGINLKTGRTIKSERADGHVKTGKKFKINEGFFEEVKE